MRSRAHLLLSLCVWYKLKAGEDLDAATGAALAQIEKKAYAARLLEAGVSHK